MAEQSESLEYTPTWVVAVVCFIIVLISLFAERGLHRLGKFFREKNQDALYEALQKLKEELMLLGFISLLLTVSQGAISKICIPENIAKIMLPCKLKELSGNSSHLITGRHLLAGSGGADHCSRHEGQTPLLSLEALHQLHIFIFVLAVTHVIFCATTMVLGGAKVAFFKQFYGSVTKSDYVVLRTGFIREHCPTNPKFNFHKYMLRTLEHDFKRIVGIRVIVQVLCSYSTLPLYAIVTQMGSRFKQGIFDQHTVGLLKEWASAGKAGSSTQNRMVMETLESICVSKRSASNEIQEISSTVELSYPNKPSHTT
ncbi:MLO-like protein 13 [Capsicum annuum]|nr:MLO-like protein 13 [Capsicum annuum]